MARYVERKLTKKQKLQEQKLMRNKANVDRTKVNNMTTGVYYFRYNAKWKERLRYWDRQPLAYPLDFGYDSMLAINLHWVNPLYRVKFVWQMNRAANAMKNPNQFVRWTYHMIKTEPHLKYLQKGIRRYLNNRISNLYNVKKEEFGYMTLINSKYFANKVAGGGSL